MADERSRSVPERQCLPGEDCKTTSDARDLLGLAPTSFRSQFDLGELPGHWTPGKTRRHFNPRLCQAGFADDETEASDGGPTTDGAGHHKLFLHPTTSETSTYSATDMDDEDGPPDPSSPNDVSVANPDDRRPSEAPLHHGTATETQATQVSRLLAQTEGLLARIEQLQADVAKWKRVALRNDKAMLEYRDNWLEFTEADSELR